MEEWHIDFLRRMDMLCLRATNQGRLMFSLPAEASPITACEDGQASNPALITPKPIMPEASDYSSYFPTRIMGYLSYEDEPDNP